MLGRTVFVLLFVFATVIESVAQQTIVFGKVKDAETGDPVPFANVVFKGSLIGTTTSFDGDFRLSTNSKVDTIVFSYVGYKPMEFAIRYRQEQRLDVQLLQDVIRLDELIVYPGENPAFEIMRGVTRQRKINDKRSLDAFQYETYTKIEIDIDNMSEQFRQRKVVKKATAVLDSIQTIA
jgi:hypothetical protein